MTEPRKPGLILPFIVAIVVLISGYVGAFYALAVPVNGRRPAWRFTDMDAWDDPGYVAYNDRFDKFFAPMIRIDKCLRPHLWEQVPWP